jgi:hypothetical protein
MTAPMPLRFYNPVKELCTKVNLDYETVIGTGLSAKMREAYVLADIGKELKDINAKDRMRVKNKVESLNRKYGTGTSGNDGKEGPTSEAIEDKGRLRYDAELIVESIQPDTSEVDESETVRYGLENHKPIEYRRKDLLWCPGRGVIPGSELGKS